MLRTPNPNPISPRPFTPLALALAVLACAALLVPDTLRADHRPGHDPPGQRDRDDDNGNGNDNGNGEEPAPGRPAIAFRDDDGVLHVMDEDGSNVTAIATDVAGSIGRGPASWSPDGTRIVFGTNLALDEPGIYYYDFATDQSVPVSTGFNGAFSNPAWPGMEAVAGAVAVVPRLGAQSGP